MQQDEKERRRHEKEGEHIGGLHPILVEKGGDPADDNIFETVAQARARKVAVSGNVVHLPPILHRHIVADVRSAVSAVHVFLLGDAEAAQSVGALFVLRPCVKVTDPFAVIVDLPEISPLLPGVGGGVESVQDPHTRQQDQGETDELAGCLSEGILSGIDPFGDPEHSRDGQHKIKNVLPHGVGEPGEEKGRNAAEKECPHRAACPRRGETEDGGRCGDPGGGGVLRLRDHVQADDQKENRRHRQGRFPHGLRTFMPEPYLHAALIDCVQACDLHTVHKKPVPWNKTAQRIKSGQDP